MPPRPLPKPHGRPPALGSRATAAPATAAGQAKERARRAWQVLRGDPRMAATVDRLWSETLQHVADADPERAAVMFGRVAVMFEVMVDRRTWPAVVRGLPRIMAGR
jgi:hypothetical protein